MMAPRQTAQIRGHSDTGGASRFFYTAKASRSEREAGLDGVEAKKVLIYSEKAQGPLPQQTPSIPSQRANHHPTVKPIALMRYMIRLVAPRGAVVLDPFMGSGSTGCAAMVEGMQFIGIDITPEYVDIARRRLAWWSSSSPLDNMATMELHEENDV
jgi:site-specific DNA-methyltransferase (adenine-specific)